MQNAELPLLEESPSSRLDGSSLKPHLPPSSESEVSSTAIRRRRLLQNDATGM